jgi:acetylornithine/succinyldiaminopimelate/putrescine aminotransferase
MGLMLGVELGDLAKGFQAYALARRLLVNVAGGRTVRLVPPLIISKGSIQELDAALSSYLHGN